MYGMLIARHSTVSFALVVDMKLPVSVDSEHGEGAADDPTGFWNSIIRPAFLSRVRRASDTY